MVISERARDLGQELKWRFEKWVSGTQSVKPGQEFSIEPDLEHVFAEDRDFIHFQPIDLCIEGLGKVQIKVMIDKRKEEREEGFLTPAGPIEFDFRPGDSIEYLWRNNYPYTVRLVFFDLPVSRIDGVRATLFFRDKKYTPAEKSFGDSEIFAKGASTFWIEFWRDRKTGVGGRLLFPQDPSIFREIRLLIDFVKR